MNYWKQREREREREREEREIAHQLRDRPRLLRLLLERDATALKLVTATTRCRRAYDLGVEASSLDHQIEPLRDRWKRADASERCATQANAEQFRAEKQQLEKAGLELKAEIQVQQSRLVEQQFVAATDWLLNEIAARLANDVVNELKWHVYAIEDANRPPDPRMHGMSDTPEYRTWCGMRQRCLNPSSSSYADYGGRGIRVCDAWLEAPDGFLRFFEDMGRRPAGCSIDRIDVNGHYEKSNCRWATAEVQASNKRNSKKGPG